MIFKDRKNKIQERYAVERFSLIKHVPHYTQCLIDTLRVPFVIYFTLLGNFVMIVQIIMFHYFEWGMNPNINTIFDSIWWGMSTVTTVGYGDITPVTFEGRIVAMGLMVTGLICFLSFTAILVSVFLSEVHEDINESTNIEIREQLKTLVAQIDRLEKRFEEEN